MDVRLPPVCARCRTESATPGRLYCDRCRQQAEAEGRRRLWYPGVPLDVYGSPPTPVPQGRGSTEVAYWEARTKRDVGEEVATQPADLMNRKLDGMRASYVRILDRFRLAEDTSTRGADLIGELGTHLEEVAGTVAFLVSVVVELRQEVAELKGGRR